MRLLHGCISEVKGAKTGAEICDSAFATEPQQIKWISLHHTDMLAILFNRSVATSMIVDQKVVAAFTDTD